MSKSNVTENDFVKFVFNGVAMPSYGATLQLNFHTAGNATGLDGNPAFKSMDGSKTRVAGTISGGTRTITAVDAT